MEHRKILDDLFNACTMIGRGNYVRVYDVKENIFRFSPAAVELFGLESEYISGENTKWEDYIRPEDRFIYTRMKKKLLAGEVNGHDLNYRTRLKDGSYAVLRHIGSTIFDADGKPEVVGGIMINEGLTETIDLVTMLPNQYGFFRDLTAAIELKRNCVAVLCGVNRMTNINEEHGYAFGNAVLQQAGWLLQEAVGQEGTVYRMEGAKFAFLSESLSPEEVAVRYEKLRRAAQAGLPVENVRQVLSINGGMIYFEGGSADERTIFASLNFVYNFEYA